MRSTAVTRAPVRPVASSNDGSCGWCPWPHSQIWVADSGDGPTMARLASISSMSSAAAGPRGSMAGRPVRSWGGVQEASAQLSGATTMWRYWTPGWNSISPPAPRPRASSSASMTSGRVVGRGVAAGEVDHGAVAGRPRPGCSGRRPGRDAASAPGRRPRWAPGRCGSGRGRSRGSTCCPRRCPAPSAAGSPRPAPPRRGPPAGPGWAWRRPRAASAPRARRSGRRRSRRERRSRTSRRQSRRWGPRRRHRRGARRSGGARFPPEGGQHLDVDQVRMCCTCMSSRGSGTTLQHGA